jgi:hypothetical protein
LRKHYGQMLIAGLYYRFCEGSFAAQLAEGENKPRPGFVVLTSGNDFSQRRNAAAFAILRVSRIHAVEEVGVAGSCPQAQVAAEAPHTVASPGIPSL